MTNRRFPFPFACLFCTLLLMPLATFGGTAQRTGRQEKLNRCLVQAVKSKDVASVIALLHSGADANAHDTVLTAPPHSYQPNSRPSSTKPYRPSVLLLATEWKYGTFRHHGFTIYHVPQSASRTAPAIVKALLDGGAQIEVRNAEECTPLMLAAWQGNHAVVKLLLEHGAQVNATGRANPNYTTRTSVLMLACVLSDAETVRLLLTAHANVNYKEKDGTTALGYAKAHGEPGKRVALLLRQAGAKE